MRIFEDNYYLYQPIEEPKPKVVKVTAIDRFPMTTIYYKHDSGADYTHLNENFAKLPRIMEIVLNGS